MARASAEQRLTRLLAIIPWVVEQGGASISSIAERFHVPEREVLAELSLVQCCEIPPYGPDNTLGIAVVGDEVLVEPSAMFHRPLRLGPREGFGLLTAGRAALSVPGSDPSGTLAGALAKLQSALDERASVVVELDQPPLLAVLQQAVDARAQLDIDYYAAYRDELGERVVDPLALVNRDGNWYLRAWCHRAGDERTFRVDRIERAEPTGVSHERPGDGLPARYAPGDDGQEVVLSIPASQRWVVETYPTLDVVDVGDHLEVKMVVAGDVFLERLLLRLGSKATVLEPAGMRDVGRRAAERLLSRYR